MKNIKKILLLLIVVLFLSNCSLSNDDMKIEPDPNIVGSWTSEYSESYKEYKIDFEFYSESNFYLNINSITYFTDNNNIVGTFITGNAELEIHIELIDGRDKEISLEILQNDLEELINECLQEGFSREEAIAFIEQANEQTINETRNY